MAEETTPVKEAPDESTLETSPLGVDMLTPEAPPDEPSVDDSAEAEDTGARLPLHRLLLGMTKDDDELESKTDLDKLGRMLDDGAQVNTKYDDGGTALHLAVEKGLVEAVTKLIDAKADVSEPDNEGQQPLHKACLEGNLDVVNLLLEQGAHTQIAEEDGWSPLHFASRRGHKEIIQVLLKKDKANIDATESLSHWTALHMAVYYGHGNAVSALLEQGANVGIRDTDGWTPLMTAIKQKHKDIVGTLLSQKGDLELETPSESGHTPLLVASINGFSDGASLLINAGADCNSRSKGTKSTPLIVASNWGHSGIVKTLLGVSRTDVNAQDEDMWTALHEASNRGHSKIVEILLQHQANVGMGNNDERSPLHLASKKGNENIVKQLLKAEAKVDAKDKDGETALHLASGAGPEDYSKHEGEQGPDDLSSDERWMAQFCTGWHAAVVKLLLERGAKPDAKTNQNETALHLAAARGDPTRLRLILDKMEQGHISTKNYQGKTALYLACTGDSPKMAVECLLKSDKLRTAEFGRRDGKDDEIKWASNYPETHEIAKWLMEKRLEREEMAIPKEESNNWSVIEWAAYSQLPEVLSSLIAQSRGSSELQAALESALKSTLKLTLQSVDESREDAEQNKLPEILSLLIIANYPLKPDIEVELKNALEWTLNLARVKGPKQGPWHRQLLQVLTPLIANFSGTTEIEKALESTLELVKTPEEGVTYEQLSQVLWLLIANSSRTPGIDDVLQSARESILKSAEETESQSQDPKPVSKPLKTPKAEAGASAKKRKNEDPEEARHRSETARQRTPSTARTTKDLQTDFREVILDILRDPPFSQTHKDSKIDGLPKHNPDLSKTLESFEATVVQFYKREGESGTFRRYRSLKEVIYNDGPGSIMRKTVSQLREVLGSRSEIANSVIYLNSEPKFMWVHLPATNMVWMNDILMRIMNDEGCEARQYHELKTFFRDSWIQVPDRTSSSRSMRPRTVVRRQQKQVSRKYGNIKKEEEEKSDKGNKEARKEEEEDRREEFGKVKNETDSKEDRQEKSKPDFGAASATYMPYFCLSTYYPNDASLCEKQTRFKDMKTAYKDSKGAQSPVIHESPTLDEWYYQFATDDESHRDRRRRNKSQIVTKAMEGSNSTKKGEYKLIRVNQLWAWTIGNKWLITATSDLFDDSNDTLVEGILEQLGKEAEAGGSASQPESAAEMCRIIVDYCISTYERPLKLEELKPQDPKTQDQGSIRQLFSKTTNQIGRAEATLFDKFREQTENWRPSELEKATKDASSMGDEASSLGSLKGSPRGSSNKTSETSSRNSVYEDIRKCIIEAEEMCCDIKDIRDELDILRSAAQHQKTVEERLKKWLKKGSQSVDLAAAYILKDLQEMDTSASRIQSAINTTLSLLQSESANLQATLSLEQNEEARKQGKTLMAFTLVTILFLPLSFLSSLFALDVASFLEAPGWAFAVIFVVSVVFSVIIGLVAQHWEKINKYLKKRMSQDKKPPKPGLGSPEEKGPGKVDSRGALGGSPEPRSEPATYGHQQPLFPGIRGRLNGREWNVV